MTHVREVPRFWNEVEGEIIRAIAILGLRTYSDIFKLSSIPEDIFDSMLNGLLYDGDLQVSENNEYTVELKLYNEYKEYFRTHEDKEIIDVIEHNISEKQIDHYNDVKDWIKLHSPERLLNSTIPRRMG